MKPVEIEFLMKDGLSQGVDKSREGVEQLLDASRRVVEAAGQMGQEGVRASDQYSSKLNSLRQGVEKMSSSLKAVKDWPLTERSLSLVWMPAWRAGLP